MSATDIEWATDVWNPMIGCRRVSDGCTNCYAIVQARIRSANPNRKIASAFAGTVARIDGRLDWTGLINLLPDRLDQPRRWRKPRRIFVNSMSDLFEKGVPDEFITRVFDVMASTPRHTFQVLTKRPGRMRSFVNRYYANDGGADGALPNVWLGVSVESQDQVHRIVTLGQTQAAVRWVSFEPLLGPIKLDLIRHYEPDHRNCSGILSPAHEPGCGVEMGNHWIDWAVVGGESGHGARPMNPAWARSLRDQCTAAGVPFLFKQHGDWAPAGEAIRLGVPATCTWTRNEIRPAEHWFPGATDERFTHTVVRRVGKKAAGRELDGRTWDEYPAVAG